MSEDGPLALQESPLDADITDSSLVSITDPRTEQSASLFEHLVGAVRQRPAPSACCAAAHRCWVPGAALPPFTYSHEWCSLLCRAASSGRRLTQTVDSQSARIV